MKFTSAKNRDLPRVSCVSLRSHLGSALVKCSVLHFMQWLAGMGSYVNMMDEVYWMNSSSIICEYLARVLYLSFLEKMSQGIETSVVMDFVWQMSISTSELFSIFKLVLERHKLYLNKPFCQWNSLQSYKFSRDFSNSIIWACPTTFY